MPFDHLRELGRVPNPGTMTRRAILAWGGAAMLVGWALAILVALATM